MSEESEDSFEKRVESAKKDGDDSSGSDYNGGVIVLISFVIGGIIGGAANPSDPVAGFFLIGLIFSFVAWLAATESGKEFREEMDDNMQQQQQEKIGKSSRSKVVCQECGWKNPEDNNYCHDCGESL